MEACCFLKALLPGKFQELPLAATAADMVPWQALWLGEPAGWAALLRLAKRRAGMDLEATVAALRTVPSLVKLLDSTHRVTAEEDDEYLCGHCGKWLRTMNGLHRHQLLVHGLGNLAAGARAVVAGSVCPSCNADFRSRIRCVRHLLHGAGDRVRALKGGLLARLDVALIAECDEADKADRATRRKAGVRDSEGMPFLPG